MIRRILALMLLLSCLMLCVSCSSKNEPYSLSADSLSAPVPARDHDEVLSLLLEIGWSDDESFASENSAESLSTVQFAEPRHSALYNNGYLYVLSNSDIKILRADRGQVTLLSATGFSSVSDAESYEFSEAFYVSGEEMVVITTASFYSEDRSDALPQNRTYAKIFDISSPSAPELTAEFSQDGVYQDSGMVNGVLYLISVDTVNYDADADQEMLLPRINDNGAEMTIPAERIYLTDSPDSAYTIVSSILPGEARRGDVCAFVGSNDHTVICESGLYLARTVELCYDSDPYEQDQYSVTDHSSANATELKRLSCDSALSLLSSHSMAGAPLALDYADGNVRLASRVTQSEYQLFTDETYGWTNRLDGVQVQSTALTILDEALTIVSQNVDLFPDASGIHFSGSSCYAVTSDAQSPLILLELSDAQNPLQADVSDLSAYSNYLMETDRGILDLVVELDAQGTPALALRLLYCEDGLLSSVSGTYFIGDYTGNACYATASPDGSYAVVTFDGETHLLRIGSEIMESGLLKISAHSGTQFLFTDGYLYACAPDSVSGVALSTAEVVSALSFGVG